VGLLRGGTTHYLPCPTVRRLARKRRNAGDGDLVPLNLNYRVHVASVNNFPTAAGLASSAAGYACLGGCPQRPQHPVSWRRGVLHSGSIWGAQRQALLSVEFSLFPEHT
jgi:hypothetical protein